MTKISAAFFFLVLFFNCCNAQKVETIHLGTATATRVNTDFYIDIVEDQRADKTYIGTVHKGLEKTKYSARLGISFTKEIKRFLEKTYSKTTTKRPLKLLIHELWITEKTVVIPESASLELIVEVQEMRDSIYVSLGFYEQLINVKGGGNVTKKHPENIRKGLLACLKDFAVGKPTEAIDMELPKLSFINAVSYTHLTLPTILLV